MGLQESEMHPIRIKLLRFITAVQALSWPFRSPVHFFPHDSAARAVAHYRKLASGSAKWLIFGTQILPES